MEITPITRRKLPRAHAKGVKHYRITLTHNGLSHTIEYSRGSAHGGLPTYMEVMQSLLMDAQSVEDCDGLLEFVYQFDLDLSTPQARKYATYAYESCVATRKWLTASHTPEEIATLYEGLDQ